MNKINVVLLHHTPLYIAASGARTCWDSFDKSDTAATVDEAVEWGLISPYKIIVVKTSLNKVIKNVAAGSKLKPFFQTEQAAYDYVSNSIFN